MTGVSQQKSQQKSCRCIKLVQKIREIATDFLLSQFAITLAKPNDDRGIPEAVHVAYRPCSLVMKAIVGKFGTRRGLLRWRALSSSIRRLRLLRAPPSCSSARSKGGGETAVVQERCLLQSRVETTVGK